MNKASPNWLNFLSISFLVLWLVLACVPFLWTFWGSFKVQADFSPSRIGKMQSLGFAPLLKQAQALPLTAMKVLGFKKVFGKRLLTHPLLLQALLLFHLRLALLADMPWRDPGLDTLSGY